MYQIWALRLSIAITFIVALLSWLNAVKILELIVRAGVSFGVMYLLLVGSLRLFERTAPPKPKNEQINSDSGRGSLVDFSVGDDELQTQPDQDPRMAGQVDPGLSEGIQDSERQAEIVRRMGWN